MPRFFYTNSEMKLTYLILFIFMNQTALKAQATNMPPIRYINFHDTDIVKNNSSGKKIKTITSYTIIDAKKLPSLILNYNENGDLTEVISYEDDRKHKITTYIKNKNENREKSAFYKKDGTLSSDYIEIVRIKNPANNTESITTTYYPDKNSFTQELLYNKDGKISELKDYQYNRLVRSTEYIYQNTLLTKEIFSSYQYATSNPKPEKTSSEVIYKHDSQGNITEISAKDNYIFFYDNNKLIKEKYTYNNSLKLSGEINYIYNPENKVIKIQEQMSDGCKMEMNIEYDQSKFKKVTGRSESSTQFCFFRYGSFMQGNKENVLHYTYDSNKNMIQYIVEKDGKTDKLYEYEIQYF